MAKPKEISLILAQHIQFNAVKGKRHNIALTTPHSKLNEPPLPVSVDLFSHGKTGKKSKVECLNFWIKYIISQSTRNKTKNN